LSELNSLLSGKSVMVAGVDIPSD
jgi:hypothetical protein